MKIVRETFRLESAKSQINLSKPYSCVYKLRISQFIYKTASIGNYVMLIIVNGFNDHKYNDNGKTIMITKLKIMPRVSLVEIDNEYTDNDGWDCIKNRPAPINSFLCELVINNDYSITDISPSNPCYLEFTFEVDDE